MQALLNRTTDPADLLTLAEAKQFLRVNYTDADNDAVISALIKAATVRIEGRDGLSGKALTTQSWTYAVDRVNGERLYLPITPIASITSIEYLDQDEATQSLTVSDYPLYSTDDVAWLQPKTNKDWPQLVDRPDALTVTFVAGYGAASDVPTNYIQAAKMLVASYYSHREDLSDKPMMQIPHGVAELVNQTKSGWIG